MDFIPALVPMLVLLAMYLLAVWVLYTIVRVGVRNGILEADDRRAIRERQRRAAELRADLARTGELPPEVQ